MQGSDVEGGDSSIGWSGDMELVSLDLVIGEDHLEEFGKNARSALEKQLVVRRGGSDHNVAALFGLGTEVATEHTVDGAHVLRTAAEGENRGIRLRGVVAVG